MRHTPGVGDGRRARAGRRRRQDTRSRPAFPPLATNGACANPVRVNDPCGQDSGRPPVSSMIGPRLPGRGRGSKSRASRPPPGRDTSGCGRSLPGRRIASRSGRSPPREQPECEQCAGACTHCVHDVGRVVDDPTDARGMPAAVFAVTTRLRSSRCRAPRADAGARRSARRAPPGSPRNHTSLRRSSPAGPTSSALAWPSWNASPTASEPGRRRHRSSGASASNASARRAISGAAPRARSSAGRRWRYAGGGTSVPGATAPTEAASVSKTLRGDGGGRGALREAGREGLPGRVEESGKRLGTFHRRGPFASLRSTFDTGSPGWFGRRAPGRGGSLTAAFRTDRWRSA